MKHSGNMEDELPHTLKDLRQKGDGMNLPEGYFEHMERAVFARIDASGRLRYPRPLESKSLKWRTFFNQPKAILAYAAALSLVLAAVWFVRQNESPVPNNLNVGTSLTEEDIEHYLLGNLHEFEVGHLAVLSDALDSRPQLSNPQEKYKNSILPADEIHLGDLDKILDDMTEEELEDIL